MSHGPIVEAQRGIMNALAKGIDDALNGADKANRKIGFALLIYNFGEDIRGAGRINYIGNGARSDVLVALKELVARWEGRVPPEPGSDTGQVQ